MSASAIGRVSHLRFRFPDQRDHFFGLVGRREVLAQFRVADEPAEAREDGEVLRNGRGHEQEEQLRRLGVDRAVSNSRIVPAKDDDRLFDEADERVARVGQCDAVADACAVELLAFLQRPEQRLPGFGAVRDLGNSGDEFAEHVVTLPATQVEFDRGCRNQVGDQQALCLSVCHTAHIVKPGLWKGEGKYALLNTNGADAGTKNQRWSVNPPRPQMAAGGDEISRLRGGKKYLEIAGSRNRICLFLTTIVAVLHFGVKFVGRPHFKIARVGQAGKVVPRGVNVNPS